MEHEVFVPVPTEALRQTLADPVRVARCVPGLQRAAEASADPLTGRLKLRVGGNTITYRGALRITGGGDDFAVTGEGTEARGSGSAKVALRIRLTPTEGGTTLTFSGTSTAEGRLADLPADATAAAGHRLLDRFAEALAATADIEEPPQPSVYDAPVPPPSLDPLIEDDFDDERVELPVAPPAEAAHARRTMIGRSAEEVDHAPPRGRYAPVPAPEASGAGATLRWMAPAAALALASAVVVGRALRRRR
ncbi:SRPBCC domain-containing protein [Streptomyces purpureus]|nr:SRPBCC domain-containing protein [Streptomyces purpureus]